MPRFSCWALCAGVVLVAGCRDGSSRAAPTRPTAAPPPPGATSVKTASGSAPASAASVVPPAAQDPWTSKSACLSVVRAGGRLPRTAGQRRLGSWNIRWFPEGQPGKRPKQSKLDLAWLACALVYLDADVWALQEIKHTDSARQAFDQIGREMSALGGAPLTWLVDDCPNEASQHVVLAYATARAQVTAGPWTLASLNPHGQPCQNQLRPGLAAHFTFSGGLDLSLVSVHLKSGRNARDIDLRRRSWQGLVAATQELSRQTKDSDVVFAGDFNTMGCSKCSPESESQDELLELESALAGQRPPLRRLALSAGCTEKYRSHGSRLDHFITTRSMQEVASDTQAQVGGFCRAACSWQRQASPPAEALSDHCPLLLDIADQDRD